MASSAHLKSERIMKSTEAIQPSDVTPATANTARASALPLLRQEGWTYREEELPISTSAPQAVRSQAATDVMKPFTAS